MPGHPARLVIATVAGCITLGLAGCRAPVPNAAAETASQQSVEPGQLAESEKNVIAILGDSLTAGLGLTTTEAFPSRLQELFAAEGYNEVEILNAGESGDTTATALRRVESLLSPNVRIVVVALGGNDALRGLSVTQTRENLQAIINLVRAANVRVMLTGMEGPTNLGEDYRTPFRALYGQLARESGRDVSFVSFLLEGVAGNPDLNQADGIHPNQQGARAIAAHLYPHLRDMVDQLPNPADRR
jgi:acyl-CoA thioesterase I